MTVLGLDSGTSMVSSLLVLRYGKRSLEFFGLFLGETFSVASTGLIYEYQQINLEYFRHYLRHY